MARHGKIARLQKPHRDQVSHLLQNGASAQTVIEYVAGLVAAGERDADGAPVEPLNDVNVTLWRQGGYEDWLKEQRRLEDMRLRRDAAFEIITANEGAKIQEASLNIAASQLYEVLTEMDLAGLKDKLKEKPELYPEVIRSLAPIAKAALDVEKWKENVRERKAAIERELGVALNKGGITKETREKIERELNLL